MIIIQQVKDNSFETGIYWKKRILGTDDSDTSFSFLDIDCPEHSAESIRFVLLDVDNFLKPPASKYACKESQQNS